MTKLGKTGKVLDKVEDVIDPNKIRHIFDNLDHNLDDLVSIFGSKEEAYKAMKEAKEGFVNQKGIDGIFEEVIEVGGERIVVRGNVIDGEVYIGTAFKP